MRGRKICTLATVFSFATFGLCVVATAPAFAAPPPNDTIQTATEITSIPFTDTVDTTDATTDAFETSLNADCGAPTVEHGVWYHATVAQSGNYTADVSQSSYGAGVMVFEGPANAPTFLTCGPETVSGPLTAGQDVFLLVFGDGTTPQTSGTMVLTLETTPPPPTGVEVTINPRGSVARDGSASISGTLTCTGEPITFEGVFGTVQQRVGRALFSSFFFIEPDVACDGVAHAWLGTARASNGLFGGGHATVDVQANICNQSGCTPAEATATVSLSRAKHH
jgi:hypothetical protein